jgi:hypothetical protein
LVHSESQTTNLYMDCVFLCMAYCRSKRISTSLNSIYQQQMKKVPAILHDNTNLNDMIKKS